jgi:hypothetical protein
MYSSQFGDEHSLLDENEVCDLLDLDLLGFVDGYQHWGCKANARVKPAKMGHGPHSSKILCFSMYCLLCHSVYCLCVNVYCATATG